MVYVPERRLLFTGDCVEDPFPQLYSGPVESWIVSIRSWAARAVDVVIPAHGRIGGKELLLGNAAYLESLATDSSADAAWPAFYQEGHRQNLAAAKRLGERAQV